MVHNELFFYGQLSEKALLYLTDAQIVACVREYEALILNCSSNTINGLIERGNKIPKESLVREIKYYWPHRNRPSLEKRAKEHIKLMVSYLKEVCVAENKVKEKSQKRKAMRQGYEKTFVAVGKRDGFICRYCKENRDLTIDHVLSLHMGGDNYFGNLQLLCKKCNSSKGAR